MIAEVNLRRTERVVPGQVIYVEPGADLGMAKEELEAISHRRVAVEPVQAGTRLGRLRLSGEGWWKLTVTPQFADDGV